MPHPPPETQQTEMLEHIRAMIEQQKREITSLYSEMKLRLPTYMKNLTIDQLRDAGATVDPDISFPEGCEEHLRKRVRLLEKFKEVREAFVEQVNQYYEDLKKNLPKELLCKKVEDLTDDELITLGFDDNFIEQFRIKVD